jgi:hypothetical protein
MQDFDTLLGQLVAALRANATLVSALGGNSSAIVQYSAEFPVASDLMTVVRNMEPPTLLVAWTETRIGDRSNRIEHFFTVYCSPLGKIATVFTALREGAISPSGTKFKRYQLSNAVHPTDVQECAVRSEPVDMYTQFEYYAIKLRITERGVDS